MDLSSLFRPTYGQQAMIEKSLKESVHCRWLIRRDMPAILSIEQSLFSHAWQEEDFIRCMRQRNVIGMVAEIDETIVGYMIYELWKNRMHVANFAVAKQHQRKGVGTAMIERLRSNLSHERRNRIMLEVRETNLNAQLFFRSRGFRAISVIKDFYEDAPGEDAYLFQYRYLPTQEELDEIAHRNRVTKTQG
jgi:[ribosomal protein S18]-alanine N-acetyltransferase